MLRVMYNACFRKWISSLASSVSYILLLLKTGWTTDNSMSVELAQNLLAIAYCD